jgi:predicted GTPase
VVLVVGRTGDGKSAVCFCFAKHLGLQGPTPFEESDSLSPHTHEVSHCILKGIVVADTPGLMDSRGVTQDEANLKKIVDWARAAGVVHAVLFLVNEQAVRFDDGMQNAIKLLVDSFGPAMLGHVGIVFSHAYGDVTPEKARLEATNIAKK